MELRDVELTESPGGSGFVRLSGRVTYDEAAHADEEYWFDVASPQADLLTTSGNPWLACLAPVAATIGEPLRLGPAVDARLLENIRELLRVWTAWYPRLEDVPIEAQVDGPAPAPERRTAAFFSGGVDSFFTVLRHANGDGTPRTEHIDDLIFIRGFDIARRAVDRRHRVVPGGLVFVEPLLRSRAGLEKALRPLQILLGERLVRLRRLAGLAGDHGLGLGLPELGTGDRVDFDLLGLEALCRRCEAEERRVERLAVTCRVQAGDDLPLVDDVSFGVERRTSECLTHLCDVAEATVHFEPDALFTMRLGDTRDSSGPGRRGLFERDDRDGTRQLLGPGIGLFPACRQDQGQEQDEGWIDGAWTHGSCAKAIGLRWKRLLLL